jgi:hypothetical protein
VSRANACRASGLTIAQLLGHSNSTILPTYVKPSTRIRRPGTKLFEIDTGAPKNVIGVNVAREIAKVQLNSRMTIKGLSGSVRNAYGIDKTALYFDHVQQYAENQIAVDLQHLSDATGTEISGFLGVNTFNSHDITIGLSRRSRGLRLPVVSVSARRHQSVSAQYCPTTTK